MVLVDLSFCLINYHIEFHVPYRISSILNGFIAFSTDKGCEQQTNKQKKNIDLVHMKLPPLEILISNLYFAFPCAAAAFTSSRTKL